jgi:hypothetical protein
METDLTEGEQNASPVIRQKRDHQVTLKFGEANKMIFSLDG